MARSRSRIRQRDLSTPTRSLTRRVAALDNALLLHPAYRFHLPSLPHQAPVLFDSRVYHPERVRVARTFNSTPARITEKVIRGRYIPAFVSPQNVLTCVRRKSRREVLHALKRTSGGAGKPRRRNYNSGVKC